MARHASGADLLLIHDPELLLALPARRGRPPVVWDVHEDTAAALSTKPWLPRPLRPPAAVAVHTAERMAERYVHLILAEHGYVRRFARRHPVVPNTTYVPDLPAPPGDDRRVVYVGHLSPDRGTADMIELATLLRPRGITVELIGPADARARAQIEPAHAAGLLRWRDFVPNDRERVFYLDGPLFGLILLTGLGGILGIRIRRRPLRLARLAGARRAGSALPWATAVVLLVFPIAVADFDYRYLLPVLPSLPGRGPGVCPAHLPSPPHRSGGPARRRPRQPCARPGRLSRLCRFVSR